MKLAVRTIDRALKRLYELPCALRAESFLLNKPIPHAALAANREMHGTLFVRSNSENPSDLTLGIYLAEAVQSELSDLKKWEKGSWTSDQWAAFLVAAEEVSHFHYVLHHATQGTQVSQLELEVQGEIDKFALAYFAHLPHAPEKAPLHQDVFERVFENFSLHSRLNQTERERYQEANRIAAGWVRSIGTVTVPFLRRLYRMHSSQKLAAR